MYMSRCLCVSRVSLFLVCVRVSLSVFVCLLTYTHTRAHTRSTLTSAGCSSCTRRYGPYGASQLWRTADWRLKPTILVCFVCLCVAVGVCLWVWPSVSPVYVSVPVCALVFVSLHVYVCPVSVCVFVSQLCVCVCCLLLCVGTMASIGGVSIVLIQLGLYPFVNKRLGHMRTFRFAMLLCIPSFLFFPALNSISKTMARGLFWFSVALCTVLRQVVGQLSFTAIICMINNSVAVENMGTTNGFGQFCVVFAFFLLLPVVVAPGC